MATGKSNNLNVSEFLREPREATQARLAEFEKEAQKLFKDMMQKGRESRKELAVLVRRLSKQDWTMDELRGRATKLREHGMVRAEELREHGTKRALELRGRVEAFRFGAMEKLEDLQTKAVAFLGVATREQVEVLSKELEQLARRLDKADKPRKSAKRTAAKA